MMDINVYIVLVVLLLVTCRVVNSTVQQMFKYKGYNSFNETARNFLRYYTYLLTFVNKST